MTKIEKEIIEEIFKDFNDLTIKEWIAKGIKAGRKQLAEEYLKKIQIIYEDCNDERIQSIQFKIGDLGKELQKEAEK